MKKLSAIALFAGCFLFFSCNTESGGPSATEKKNIEVNDSISNAYERGDFSKMSEYIATDAVDHAGENGDIVGLDNIVNEMKRYHEMMPDMKATMTKSAATGDYVFTWGEMEGTMNGQQVKMKSMDVARFKDGKAVEHWMYMDPKDMALMMPPSQQPPMDSSMEK